MVLVREITRDINTQSYSSHTQSLEGKINEFLKSLEYTKIIDIKYCDRGALIIYEV